MTDLYVLARLVERSEQAGGFVPVRSIPKRIGNARIERMVARSLGRLRRKGLAKELQGEPNFFKPTEAGILRYTRMNTKPG